MNEPRSREPAWPERPDVEDAGLAGLRSAIDAIDREILDLLNRRAGHVLEVGALKRETGGAVYRADRERDLVAALIEANRGPFPSSGLPAVFREIISATRSLEQRLRVAFLGPEGTFSHMATREAFGSEVDLRPAPSLREVVAAVDRGEADHGVLPVENTTEGVVTQALDAVLEFDVPICGERLLGISHQLLGRASSLAEVQRVASHPQPLGQCRAWLDANLPGVPRLETASTAAAASLAAEDSTTAAIGGAILAETVELPILASAIEDRRDNTTRFLILGGTPPEPSGNDLTSLVYTVRKGESGALHRLLEPFARAGVNLTSIQARPLQGTPWEYVFFIDLEGHVADERVRRAAEAAAASAHSFRVLGSFPRAQAAAGEGA
jgi:chorismate mutase/prephenate dehydratase